MLIWMSFKSILFFSVWLYLFINDGINYWIQRENITWTITEKYLWWTYVLFKEYILRESGIPSNKTNSISILIELTVFHEKHLSVFLGKTHWSSVEETPYKENVYKCLHTWNEVHLPLLRYSWRRKKKEGGEEEEKEGRRRKKRNVTYVILTLFNLKLYFASFTWFSYLKSSLQINLKKTYLNS